MKKILIFGTDSVTERILNEVFGNERNLYKGIMGFIDNIKAKDMFYGLPVFLPRDIKYLEFDKIIVVNGGDYVIQRCELIYGYGIEESKVTQANYLISLRILDKYAGSEDGEIQTTLRNIEERNDYDLWCGYCPKSGEKYEVLWDEVTNMPYTIFADKRMYFPRNRRFATEDGKQIVTGLEFEQQEGSPHKYTTDDICIREGDVVVDAGVCEGNFSIKYIDKISKLYLVECDPAWIYPLKLTFREYLDKIVFCSKFLGDVDGEKTITLDTLVSDGKADFIKMDIEGAEVKALNGGKKIFCENDIRCAVCSYHRHDNERDIRKVLEEYGYKTSTSTGHMIFFYEQERFKWSELRKGIVYGKK